MMFFSLLQTEMIASLPAICSSPLQEGTVPPTTITPFLKRLAPPCTTPAPTCSRRTSGPPTPGTSCSRSRSWSRRWLLCTQLLQLLDSLLLLQVFCLLLQKVSFFFFFFFFFFLRDFFFFFFFFGGTLFLRKLYLKNFKI